MNQPAAPPNATPATQPGVVDSVPVTVLVVVVGAEVVNLPGIVAGLGVPGVFHGLLVLAAIALVAVLRREEARRRIGPRTWWCIALLAVYLVSQTVGVVAGVEPAATVLAVERRAVDCVYLVVVLLLAVATGSAWRVAGAVVVPLAALAALSAINLLMTGGTTDLLGFSVVTQASGELTTTLRFGGPLPDSNFWGRHLVVGLPLAVALALRAHRALRRGCTVLWCGAAAALLVGMYLTQSRGTFLAAIVGVVVFLVLCDRTVRLRGLWLVPAVACLAVIPGVGDRFVALVEDLTSAPGTTAGVDPSVLGRSAAQEIAWQMFGERPLTGFGAGTYPGLVPEYADRIRTSVAEPTDGTHNLYAELAAETGALGLLGWAALVAGIGAMVLHRALITRDVRTRRLAAAVLGALAAWSVASVFLHMAYFRTFGLILVLAAVIGSQREADRWSLHQRMPLREIALMVPILVVAVLAALGTAAVRGDDGVRAAGQLVVVPRGTPDALSAWPLDVRSRQAVMPTFAALLDPGLPATGYTGDPVRGVVTVRVDAEDAATATAKLAAAETASRARLETFGLESNFRVIPMGPPEITSFRDFPPVVLASAALVAAAVLTAGWVVVRSQPALLRGPGRPRLRRWRPDPCPGPDDTCSPPVATA